MDNLKKVIKGLECRLKCGCMQEDHCNSDCPYLDDKRGCRGLDEDAHDILIAQEPRLLGLDEIKMLGLMWLESRNGFVQPVICQNYEYCADRSVEFIMVHGTSCNSINTFGKLWRVWTSKPSDEQREATPWC